MQLPNLDQVSDEQAFAVGKIMIKRILEESYTEGIFDLTTDYSKSNNVCSGTFLSDVRDRKGKRLKFNYVINNDFSLEYKMTSKKQADEVDLSQLTLDDEEIEIKELLVRQSEDTEFNESFEKSLKSVQANGLNGHAAYLYAEYLTDLYKGFQEVFTQLVDD